MAGRRKSVAERKIEAEGVALSVTRAELELISAALDSHIYWELSDRQYRSAGFVRSPGADEEETAGRIREAEALMNRLEGLRPREGA